MNGTRRIVLALLALTLAACGSSGSSGDGNARTDPSADQLTRAQLITAADKICRDTGNAVKPIRKPRSAKEYAATQAAAINTAGAFDDAVGRFNKLHPPAALRPDYDAFVTAFDAVGDQARALVRAANAGDAARIDAAFAKAASAAPVKLARKLGFKQCSG